MIKVTLQRSDGKTGYQVWESDEGLQVGMIDSKSGCKVINMEEIYDP